MNIRIDDNSIIPVYRQIANEIKSEILSGELDYGSALPSERALAKLLSVHRNTITKAYSELKSIGMIDSRQGVGYYVSVDNSRKVPAPKVASLGEASVRRNSNRSKRVNWLTEIKPEYIDHEKSFDDIFQKYRNEKKIALSTGISMPSVYRREELANDIARAVAYGGTNQYFYSPYKGDVSLRQQIVSFLSTKGIKASVAEIQVVTETNQAIDFVINLLINPGDMVIVAEPVHPDTYRALEIAGASIVTIPVDENGMNVDAVENIIKAVNPESGARPKLIMVDSSFHDPTGTCLPDDRRKQLLDISNIYRIPIIEEDAASELYYEGESIKPIKSMDKLGNVIYIYSFSLTFAPGLSLAFIVADREVIKNLSYLVSVRLVAIDWLTQKLMTDYLENGTYHEKLQVFKERYRDKRDLLVSELEKLSQRLEQAGYGKLEFRKPRGGVYIWCKLPDGIDSKEFAQRCYKEGVSVIPGYIFYPFKNGGRDYIRINYSYEKIESIPKGVKLMERAIISMFEDKL